MAAGFLKKAIWQELSVSQRVALLERPALDENAGLTGQVADIISTVRLGGDKAVQDYTARFDGVQLASVQVTEDEFDAALKLVDQRSQDDIMKAADHIHRFHSRQLPQTIDMQVSVGVRCFREFRPIDRVGLYVPGGSAPLFSTVLMTAIPANIAGCPLKIMATPPDKSKAVNPYILFAARLVGIDKVYKMGGAQAIAAMAYGTQSVPKVDKIFGPGNAWVTEAKIQVAQDPRGAASDMPAGPSEVLVIADDSADADFVAMDLLSQAEHGADSQSILLSDSPALVDRVQAAVEKHLRLLPRRSIAIKALRHSAAIQVSSLIEAVAISNNYAPEHLIINCADYNTLIPRIKNAGSVFLGPWSPESLGDYASGTNHVLPTYGYARQYSGLAVEAYIKQITFQEISPAGIRDLGPVVERLATIEGLEAHAGAVRVRRERVGKDEESI